MNRVPALFALVLCARVSAQDVQHPDIATPVAEVRVEVRSGRDGALLWSVMRARDGYHASDAAVASTADADGFSAGEAAEALSASRDGELLVVGGSVDDAPVVRVLSPRDGRTIHEVSEDVPHFGWATAAPGDVDGDGLADLLVGEARGIGLGTATPDRLLVLSAGAARPPSDEEAADRDR